jgi:hypothetical protein
LKKKLKAMPQDEYGIELNEICAKLTQAGFHPSIRGDGKARFAYIEHKERSAEICKDITGWFIYLFENQNEVSVRDEVQDTIIIAVEQVIAWLNYRE